MEKFYEHKARVIGGGDINFESLHDKIALIVNTASQ